MLWPVPLLADNGETLAKTWCSSCHTYPAPQLLDKGAWIDHVLPEMGARLGFQTFRGRNYQPNPSAPPGVYATEPLMDWAEWEQIISWYETSAPDQLVPPTWQPRTRLELFEMELPAEHPNDFPTSTAIYIDETSSTVLVGNSYELNLEIYSDDLELVEQIGSGGAISRILRLPSDDYLLTTMGGNIGQTETPLGLLIEVSTDKSPHINRLVHRLHRPVNMAFGDFNGDGEIDYVVAEFGAYAGKLSLHLSQSNGTFLETTLLNDPGAISVVVTGSDLLVLMAQGNEQIIRLKNFATTQRSIETIMQFPPSQGSSSLRVVDFNGDGLLDLLYTAGDNADISPIFKPYHGIYLYAGQANNTYKLEMFFHLDGTYDAIAEDFDQDGDLDIAAISYFPNIDQNLDETGFIYLQNNNGEFEVKYLEGIGSLGRFIAITTGDIDHDGDIDIALANLAFGPYGPMEVLPELQEQWLAGTRFILLRNGFN